MPSQMGLMDLARHLRQEYLFVSSEKQNLQALNKKVLKTTEQLYHLSWIARQQRVNFDSLVLSRRDDNVTTFSQKAALLENVNFVDSYKQLGVNDSIYADFLQHLRENPKLLAMCLNAGENINISTMHDVVHIIMSSLYGNCILPEDEIYVLTLLKELMSLQLAFSDNPRRLLRHGSCAFSQVYKIFNECLFSAKIFLTAALYEPIMHVLMEDDLFLDIDPSKAAVRFHPQERLRHFGKEGTQEYINNLARHRNWTINKLYNLAIRFIEGIRNNLCCFPQSLSWLARQMYMVVMQAKRVEVREVGAMCADLVFAFFICPAIVNPVPYGITDIHISDIARFNLMQVAQILQVLAMSKWEEIDPKLMDLYGKFEKDCVSSLLDLLLEGSSYDAEAALVNQFQEMNRSAVLITESELMSLVSFIRAVESQSQDIVLKKLLSPLTSHLPPVSLNIPSALRNGDAFSSTPGANSAENNHSVLTSKKSFLGKVGKRGSKHHSNSMIESSTEDSYSLNEGDTSLQQKVQLEDVLVVPIPGIEFECPGMLSEEKVLAVENQRLRHVRKPECGHGDEGDGMACGPEIIEKRTRFSLSLDQESVGTSDNLEAISEAASNRSIASSVDLENENDNLSDMVSANVSGRGTPNVSGRDTPSSQLEGDDQENRPLEFSTGGRRQNPVDIEEKFGKFEIQPLIEGDETKSMVSDTWSTDVLASDSEIVEQSDILPQVSVESQGLSALDASETASQSDAWSTDVLASDTERLLDIDTDDAASVARSDDAARSEADGEVAQALDITPMDSKDFMDVEQIAEVYSIGATTSKVDRFASDFSAFSAAQQSSSAAKDPLNLNTNEHGQKRETVSINTDIPVCVPDSTTREVLCPEVYDLIQTDSSLHVDCSQSGLSENLNSMQSLGRVSLAIKELTNESEESGQTLLDSLQETVNVSSDRSSHRSSIADILSLDLTRTLNLHNERIVSTDPSSSSDSNQNLMDIEKEFLVDNLLKGSNNAERGAKRKLIDSVFVDDVSTRLSAASVSSSASSNASSDASGIIKTGSDADTIPSAQFLSDASQCSKLNTSPLSADTIPKSISFDKAISNVDGSSAEDKNRKSIFKLSGFKFTFKGRNRKSPLSSYRAESSVEDLSIKNIRQSASSFAEARALQLEASDEILAKYRKKSPVQNSADMSKSGIDSVDHLGEIQDCISLDNGPLLFDSASAESSSAFCNAKRKLRLVLGSADLQTLPWQNTSRASVSTQRFHENDLIAFLKVLLAEAINLQQRPLLSHLREALRCVQMFDDLGCQKLYWSLREDYKKRAPYIAYLVRCRQGLLSTLSHLETLMERIERDKQVCNHNLIMACVRIFLDRREQVCQLFVKKFMELSVADEKAILVQNFLRYLFTLLNMDWSTANQSQLEHAQIVIERIFMGHIYMSALHPNGDGDVLRDKVLHEHMSKLAGVIVPSHKDLRIPKQYHSESPWPSAQAELDLINAYKTPRDKVQCVVRCCSTIMNLLSMASDRQVPAADDLMPVLVFVVIKANPANLLSTVQYVNTFYEKQLEGEDAYWWTQFCCAVEFIKTMDY